MNESKTLTFTASTTTIRGTEGSSTQLSTPVHSSRSVVVGRQGFENPRWRQQIARLENATTSFDGFMVRVKRTGFNFAYGWKPPVGQRNYEAASGIFHLGIVSDPLNLSDTEAKNQAIRNLTGKVLERRTAFQGGTFLAEINDTLRGIRHPLKALRDGLDAYHRKAKKLSRQGSRASAQSAIAGSWLEFQFGMLQNVRDIDSFFDNLKKISKPRAVKFSCSGKSEIQQDGTVTASAGTVGINSRLKVRRRLISTVTVTYRGAYKVLPPSGWDAKSWGLSPQDFVPSIWEAIPYSFAVDYFTNVGDIIRAYAYLTADLAWVAKTTRKSVIDSHEGYDTIPGNPAQYPLTISSVGSLGSSLVTSTRVSRRSELPSRIIPSLSFRSPEVGSLKWLNLAALVRLKTL